MRLDVLEIRLDLCDHLVRHLVAFGLGEGQSVGNVNSQEWVFIPLAVAFPKAKAAVGTLPRL